MKKLTLLFTCSLLTIFSFSQDDKKSRKTTDKEAQEILDQLQMDTTVLLRNLSVNACTCIDSVFKTETDRKKKMDGIAGCIDEQAGAYQMGLKLLNSLKSNGKDNKISINIDKESAEYKKYYYEIERWLKDSCDVMNKAISSNDEAGDKSYSTNIDARAAYTKGVEFLAKEKYTDAIPWFEKAVAIDPVFAFAWDNLGVCYRRTDKYDKAEQAYKASLKLDPKGKTALQNLPIVYMLQKKVDEAIAAYNDILKFYPDDPEVYYGIAIVYYNTVKDMEKALDNVCKAYNLYVKLKSPFRTDAEKVVGLIYQQMKKDNKEEVFNRILKENNISVN